MLDYKIMKTIFIWGRVYNGQEGWIRTEYVYENFKDAEAQKAILEELGYDVIIEWEKVKLVYLISNLGAINDSITRRTSFIT